MNTSEKSIVTFMDVGFTADSFQSFIPSLDKLPSKLKGLSLIYFIKEFGDINLSFDDDAELILSGGHEWNPNEIEEDQKVMFDMVLKQLKPTNFSELAIKEFTLWDIEQISSDISDNQEKIQKIVNKYEHLLDTEEDQNSKFLYDSINSYLNFCHLNFMDGKKSNEVFISYNEKLKIDGKITEAWVLTFIRFMLSTTHGSNSVRPGKIYILNNPETADKNFEEANNFLNKILDTNSVTKASMLFLDAKKIHHLSKKDFNSYKKLQLEYLERLKSAFTEESDEYNKACVKIADDLEWQSENESKCPDFYNDCIILGMKSLNYLLDKEKVSDELGLSNPLVSHSHLAHQYQKIASLYIKKKTSKKALDFTKKALDQYKKNFLTTTVIGTVFGKNDPRLLQIDQFEVKARLEGDVLICCNKDAPGVVGTMGTLLAENGINIADMALGRESRGGRAIMVFIVDATVSDEVLRRIESDPLVFWAKHAVL